MCVNDLKKDHLLHDNLYPISNLKEKNEKGATSCEPEAAVDMEVDEAVEVAPPEAVAGNSNISVCTGGHDLEKSEEDSGQQNTE